MKVGTGVMSIGCAWGGGLVLGFGRNGLGYGLPEGRGAISLFFARKTKFMALCPV